MTYYYYPVPVRSREIGLSFCSECTSFGVKSFKELCLSISKELIKLLNGHIKVKSIERKGTKFSDLLPYIQIKEEALSPQVANNIEDDGTAMPFDRQKTQSMDNQPIFLSCC